MCPSQSQEIGQTREAARDDCGLLHASSTSVRLGELPDKQCGSFQDIRSCWRYSWAGVRWIGGSRETATIVIAAHCAACYPACPDCGITSDQVHSCYERRLLDLPSHGRIATCASRSSGAGTAIVHDGSLRNRCLTARLYGEPDGHLGSR
jgi:hypothetical protein